MQGIKDALSKTEVQFWLGFIVFAVGITMYLKTIESKIMLNCQKIDHLINL